MSPSAQNYKFGQNSFTIGYKASLETKTTDDSGVEHIVEELFDFESLVEINFQQFNSDKQNGKTKQTIGKVSCFDDPDFADLLEGSTCVDSS